MHSKDLLRYWFLTLLVIFSSLLPGDAQAADPPPQQSPIKISRTVGGGAADSASGWPSLSADGGSIAFSSQAGNLLSGDMNAASDIFLFNTKKKAVELVSLSSQGIQANAASYHPAVAANGRFIAFTSLSTNLDEADTNGLPDIYLRDLNAGTTMRTSRPPDGSPASGWSDQAQLSSDGRFVLFISTATNLVRGLSRSARRVFLYDTHDVLLQLVSSPSGDSSLASLSADGRSIVFLSDTGDGSKLFLYDRLTGGTRHLDLDIQTPRWQQLVSQLAISADGSCIALLINGSNSATIYIYDRKADQLVKVASPEHSANSAVDRITLAMSADGRSLIYTTGKSLLLYDLGLAKSRELIRFASTAGSSTVSQQVGISPDGQIIAFQAKTGAGTDIYSLDLGPSAKRKTFISGWIQNELGAPISGVEVSDNAGHTTRTDAEGNFRFEEASPGSYTVSPIREGVTFSPANRSITATQAGISGLSFIADPERVVAEARKDIGMPYSLNRGCPSPFQECGGPFHGFYRGDCTDVIIDAYTEGVGFDIQLALDRDFLSNPRHYYRWRDARSAQDMWRYYFYTDQVLSPNDPYLPGDIVFFDWERDGVVDHVALVSEVNRQGRPRRLVDATGVTADNSSGLAAEIEWGSYQASRTTGHARWTGIRTSQNKPTDNTFPDCCSGLPQRKAAPLGRSRSLDICREYGDTGQQLSHQWDRQGHQRRPTADDLGMVLCRANQPCRCQLSFRYPAR
jgi:Tol biopolymer transport system component